MVQGSCLANADIKNRLEWRLEASKPRVDGLTLLFVPVVHVPQVWRLPFAGQQLLLAFYCILLQNMAMIGVWNLSCYSLWPPTTLPLAR